MTRDEILSEASRIVGSREADYGAPEDTFAYIADLWQVYLGAGQKITPMDVAMMMILLKVARASAGRYKPDTFIDIAGYAACAGELDE